MLREEGTGHCEVRCVARRNRDRRRVGREPGERGGRACGGCRANRKALRRTGDGCVVGSCRGAGC